MPGWSVHPHSGLLGKPPLPRSTGARKGANWPNYAPLLYPAEWGQGGAHREPEWGNVPVCQLVQLGACPILLRYTLIPMFRPSAAMDVVAAVTPSGCPA